MRVRQAPLRPLKVRQTLLQPLRVRQALLQPLRVRQALRTPSLQGSCLGPSRMADSSLHCGSGNVTDLQTPRFMGSSGLAATILVARLNSVPAGDDLLVARLNSVPARDDLPVARLNFVSVSFWTIPCLSSQPASNLFLPHLCKLGRCILSCRQLEEAFETLIPAFPESSLKAVLHSDRCFPPQPQRHPLLSSSSGALTVRDTAACRFVSSTGSSFHAGKQPVRVQYQQSKHSMFYHIGSIFIFYSE
ncbi:hypothetical protein CRENBAI_002356 [Crenichthys baileyi]|uniref:Uncharacterized protein n=1 Tax=Crenichthys baileyi TaxID=28760 RepID=A0AAV9SLP9_9TELE